MQILAATATDCGENLPVLSPLYPYCLLLQLRKLDSLS
jgi:hypothetical protein